MDKNAEQRLRDRKQPEYTQAKGHNKRVRDLYPEAWANSTITDLVLSAWIKEHKTSLCTYCQAKTKEIDHIVPLSSGGSHSLDNLQMLCLDCNRSKGTMSHEEFLAYRQVNPVLEKFKPTDEELRPRGRYRTLSLFKVSSNQEFTPVWSLEEFRQLYLDLGDPTEYRFALTYLGSWKHWKLLTKQRFLKKWLREVRDELKVRIRSQACQKLLESENLQAIKLLAVEDLDLLKPQESNPVGRPRKLNQTLLDETDDLAQDMLRIGLQ